MRLEVTTPEENLGDIVSDLQQRRAIITGTHVRGRTTVIDAQAPLANLFGYSNAMRGSEPGPGDVYDGAVQLRPRPAGGAGKLRRAAAGLMRRSAVRQMSRSRPADGAPA